MAAAVCLWLVQKRNEAFSDRQGDKQVLDNPPENAAIGSLRQGMEGLSPVNPARCPFRSRGHHWRVVGIALVLFGVGNGILYWTNRMRFGSGLEFGHQLNVQHISGSVYSTRFDYPFAREPLGSAVRELYGRLFLSRLPRLWEYFDSGLFPGQSPTLRWREVGMSTFDRSYLTLVIGSVVFAGLAALRLKWRTEGHKGPVDRAILALAVFGGVGFVLLAGFYLRCSVMASRYVLDWMPSLAAMGLATWPGWATLGLHGPGRRAVLSGTLTLLALWIGWQVLNARSGYGAPRILTWEEVKERWAPFQRETPVRFPPGPDPSAPGH